MSEDFRDLLRVLNQIGTIENKVPLNKNGKPSRFSASISTKMGSNYANMGILYYNWKRTIGVDKVNQAFQHVNRTNLDGALIVAPKFSDSAFEQAVRINELKEKSLVLLEFEELYSAFGEPSS